MAGKKQEFKQVPKHVKIEKDKSVALGSVKAEVQPDIVEKLKTEIKVASEALKSEEEIITVIGSNKAEDLQKSGYRNISATKIGTDDRGMTIKEYKFIKE